MRNLKNFSLRRQFARPKWVTRITMRKLPCAEVIPIGWVIVYRCWHQDTLIIAPVWYGFFWKVGRYLWMQFWWKWMVAPWPSIMEARCEREYWKGRREGQEMELTVAKKRVYVYLWTAWSMFMDPPLQDHVKEVLFGGEKSKGRQAGVSGCTGASASVQDEGAPGPGPGEVRREAEDADPLHE